MADAKTEEVERWMTKAHHDLDAAEYLLRRNPPLADVSVYHCQQAAEKALKAYLVAMDTPFAKTHDLTELVATAEFLDPVFNRLAEAAAILTPYATAFRYPTGQPDPSPAEARQAFAMVHMLVDFVANQLPHQMERK